MCGTCSSSSSATSIECSDVRAESPALNAADHDPTAVAAFGSGLAGCDAIAVVGAGRVGTALTSALRTVASPGALTVHGPIRRGDPIPDAPVVLLAVQDREIERAAAALPPGRIVGHCSASVPLDALAPHERFALHPLLSVTSGTTSFAGAAGAVDGSSARARAVANALASRLGMRAVHVPAERRALYHAAASVAANYLVTLEWAAEELAGECGVTRADLLPLVRSALEQWGEAGMPRALTGPVSRGDHGTVTRQREAVAASRPELLAVFDVMTDATRLALRRTLATDGAT